MFSRTPDVDITAPLRRAGVAWLVAGVLWFVLEAVAALAFPGYDYARFYISDLGNPIRELYDGRAIDSQLAWVMNVDLVVHGAAFLLGAVFAFQAARAGIGRSVFVTLVAFNTIGSGLVATFHSTNAARANGTLGLHELGALVSITAGNLAIVVAGVAARRLGASVSYQTFAVLIGIAGIASLAVLVFAPNIASRTPGVWERGSVYAIMTWEIVTAILLLRHCRRLER